MLKAMHLRVTTWCRLRHLCQLGMAAAVVIILLAGARGWHRAQTLATLLGLLLLLMRLLGLVLVRWRALMLTCNRCGTCLTLRPDVAADDRSRLACVDCQLLYVTTPWSCQVAQLHP